VTSVTEVRSASTHLPVHGTPWWVLLKHYCSYFSSLSMVLCAFSALCMYSKLGHHPHS